jgi:hypothetical protein
MAINVRACDRCHKWYYRVNKTRQWVKRNPGHRAGWKVEEAKICTDCQNQKISERVMVVAQLSTSTPVTAVKKRA